MPTSGTLMPRVGMVKVWPTPLPVLESMTRNGLAVEQGDVAGGPVT